MAAASSSPARPKTLLAPAVRTRARYCVPCSMDVLRKTAMETPIAKTRRSRDIIADNKMSEPLEPRDEFDTEQPKLDRSVVRVFSSHAEADAADKAYWLSRSPHERLRHMEIL